MQSAARHMMRAGLIVLFAGAALADAPASLGVFFDDAGTQCTGSILPGTPGTIYVMAKLGAVARPGITGAEFQFTGIPDSWDIHPVPNPEMLSWGDPFANGTNLAWSDCQAPESDTVLMYRVLVLASDVETDLEFKLEAKSRPSNPNFACPLVTLCDAPIYTKVCVESFPCFVNATSQKACSVPVAVEYKTWAGVKQVFR